MSRKDRRSYLKQWKKLAQKSSVSQWRHPKYRRWITIMCEKDCGICRDSTGQNYKLERIRSSQFLDNKLNGFGSRESNDKYYASIKHCLKHQS